MTDELKREIERIINEKMCEVIYEIYKRLSKEIDISKLPPDGL